MDEEDEIMDIAPSFESSSISFNLAPVEEEIPEVFEPSTTEFTLKFSPTKLPEVVQKPVNEVERIKDLLKNEKDPRKIKDLMMKLKQAKASNDLVPSAPVKTTKVI